MKNNTKKLLILVLLIAIVLLVYVLLNLNKDITDNNIASTPTSTSETMDKYQDEKTMYAQNKKLNNDYIGVIRFESDIINLPFVQSQKEDIVEAYDEYLRIAWDTRDYDEEGSIFLDPSNNLDDQNLVLYGHYVYPSYDPSQTHKFTPLHLLKEESNYEKNRYIDLVLENEIRRYEVAHVYYAELDLENPNQPIEEGMEYMFGNYSDEELEYYLKRVKEEEFYHTNVEIKGNDNFLTLQTCVENHDELRLIVIAKEIEVIDINE